MKLSGHYLKRYRDLTLLLLKYGQPGIGSRFAQQDASSPRNGASQTNVEELPNDLERLGPTFVKLGQLLSSRSDLLPERYVKPLARLQDRVKPFPYEDVELTIEMELKTGI